MVACLKKNNIKFVYSNIAVKFMLNIFTCLYYACFSFYLYVSFMRTTMCKIEWPDNMSYMMHHILWWVVGIKFFLNVLNKDLNLQRAIYIALLLTVSIICYKTTDGYDLVLDVAVLTVGALDVDYNVIIRIYLCIFLVLTAYVMIGSKTGTITDLIYNRNGHIRDSFGFIYPTDFAAHIFYMLCAWVLIREKKGTYSDVFFLLTVALFLQVYCEARCSVVSIALLSLLVLITMRKNKCNKNKVWKVLRIICNTLCTIFPWLMAAMIIFLGKNYKDTPTMAIIDKMISSRLSLTKFAFERYKVNMWGQPIQMIGFGGSTEHRQGYFFLDSSYVNILFQYGIAILIIALLGISIVIIKNFGNPIIVGVILVICIHSLIEHHLFEHYYNFFIILSLACFNREKNSRFKYYKIARATQYKINRSL